VAGWFWICTVVPVAWDGGCDGGGEGVGCWGGGRLGDVEGRRMVGETENGMLDYW